MLQLFRGDFREHNVKLVADVPGSRGSRPGCPLRSRVIEGAGKGRVFNSSTAENCYASTQRTTRSKSARNSPTLKRPNGAAAPASAR
jgi:hypothetical protein